LPIDHYELDDKNTSLGTALSSGHNARVLSAIPSGNLVVMAEFTVKPWPEILPYDAQCYEVSETSRPGQTCKPLSLHISYLQLVHIIAHHRNAIIRDFPVPGADSTQQVTTVYDCFEVTHKAHPEYRCLGYRPIISGNIDDPARLEFVREYVWQTYAEVAQLRLDIGGGIQALFDNGLVGGGELPTVGTWMINRPGMWVCRRILDGNLPGDSFRVGTYRPGIERIYQSWGRTL
jgi:hypothetical protein